MDEVTVDFDFSERLSGYRDLLFEIVKRLDVFALKRFAATSKAVQRLIDPQQIWSEISLGQYSLKNYPEAKNIFDDIMSKMSYVKRIMLKKTVGHHLHSAALIIPRVCTNLTYLDLFEIPTPFSIEFMNELFLNCPNLTLLKIDHISMWRDERKHYLENIVYADLGQLTGTTLDKYCENVVELDKNWTVMSPSLEKLHMRIRSDDLLPASNHVEFYIGVLKRCPNIIELFIDGNLDEKK
jgi:hypothetical protein